MTLNIKLHGQVTPNPAERPDDGLYALMIFLGYDENVSKDNYEAVLPMQMAVDFIYVTEDFDVEASTSFSFMRQTLRYKHDYTHAKAYVNHIEHTTWYARSAWAQNYYGTGSPFVSTV